ncbi:MAG: ribosome recycling factor [Planctomycetota bacterium]|jgi:ribosome recycling factor
MEEQAELILVDFKEKLEKAVHHLVDHLKGIRTGHASPALVDSIKVEAYGTLSPLNQLANISVPEPRQLMVKPFDPSIMKDVEKAILTSDLGLMPNSDGKVLRLSLPPLSEEQRGKLAAKVKEIAESSRVALRNARRDANKHADQAKKDSDLTEDQNHDLHDQIQTDLKAAEGRIDEILAKKTKEIMED